MRAFIIAAGRGSRWNDYLGVKKQMIDVGEPLLHRTIKQLKKRGCDVTVTVPRRGYYGRIPAKQRVGKDDTEIDKILNTSNADFLFLGDVYYTEEAMDTILSCKEPFMFFGILGRSTFSKGLKGEIYAVKVNDHLYKKAKELKQLYKSGKVERCKLWELYRYTMGMPFHMKRTGDKFTTIDDATYDFDTPKDYLKWRRAMQMTIKPTISVNIMAHISRKDYIPYLKEKLGNVRVLWSRGKPSLEKVWENRKRCLLDHKKKGKDFCLTIQDDAIICENFNKRLFDFIDSKRERWVYNLFFSHQAFSKDIFMNAGDFYKCNKLKNEIALVIPKEAIDPILKLKSENEMVRYLQENHPSCYLIPSLVNHREGESLWKHYREPVNARAWWFADDPKPEIPTTLELRTEPIKRQWFTRHHSYKEPIAPLDDKGQKPLGEGGL